MKTRREFLKSAVIAGAALSSLSQKSVASTDLGSPVITDSDLSVATIDWSSHWISPGAVRALKSRTTAPNATLHPDGSVSVVDLSGETIVFSAESLDIARRSRAIGANGISRQVLSWPVTLGLDAALTSDEARVFWTAFNNDVAAVVKGDPKRYSGLAGVPTSDPDWAASEIDRAHDKLGLIGFTLPSGGLETYEGAEKLHPIFAAAQKNRSHIYIQPGRASYSLPGYTEVASEPGNASGLRNRFDVSETLVLAAITLTNTGFLDSYPDISIQIAQLGGGTPILASLLAMYDSRDGIGDGLGRLRQLYYDTAESADAPHALEFAVGTIGSNRLLFGSGYPAASMSATRKTIATSAIAASDKLAVIVQTGQGLFQTKAKALA